MGDDLDICDVCKEPINRDQMARFEYRGGSVTATRSVHESCVGEGPPIALAARVLYLAVRGFDELVRREGGREFWDEGPHYLSHSDLMNLASGLNDLADLWERG